MATEPSNAVDEYFEPTKARQFFADPPKNRQNSLKETVDDIMYTLIENGEAKVTNIRGMRE